LGKLQIVKESNKKEAKQNCQPKTVIQETNTQSSRKSGIESATAQAQTEPAFYYPAGFMVIGLVIALLLITGNCK
jgi:hypothetical protein